MGYAHAEEVLDGRKRTIPVELGRLSISRRMVGLPMQKPWTLQQLMAMGYFDTVIAAFGAKFPQVMALARKRRAAPCEGQVLSLNAAHHLVYLGGEICTDIGIGLRDLCPGQIVTPHGCANSAIGYVSAEHMYPQDGYEVEGNFFSNGLPAPFVPNVQEYLWRAALSMIAAAKP
jgi:hypothetical protein